MEIVSVEAEFSQPAPEKLLESIQIPYAKLPDMSYDTYRITYTDATHSDVKAGNASNAYQMADAKPIQSIINIRYAYGDVLYPGSLTADNALFTPNLNHDDHHTTFLYADVMPQEKPAFVQLAIQDVVAATTES